jgi:hypothetical protein
METVRCPYCGTENELESEQQEKRSFQIDCVSCLKGFFFEVVFIRHEKRRVVIPRFLVNEQVYVVNKDHELNLEPATIVQKDFAHARIRVRRGKRNVLIWVPVTWLQKSF